MPFLWGKYIIFTNFFSQRFNSHNFKSSYSKICICHVL